MNSKNEFDTWILHDVGESVEIAKFVLQRNDRDTAIYRARTYIEQSTPTISSLDIFDNNKATLILTRVRDNERNMTCSQEEFSFELERFYCEDIIN